MLWVVGNPQALTLPFLFQCGARAVTQDFSKTSQDVPDSRHTFNPRHGLNFQDLCSASFGSNLRVARADFLMIHDTPVLPCVRAPKNETTMAFVWVPLYTRPSQVITFGAISAVGVKF